MTRVPGDDGLSFERPSQTIDFLRETIGLTEEDIAIAVGVSRRTIRRWSTEVVSPQPVHAARLDDLRSIVQFLADIDDDFSIRPWLCRRNAKLDWERPLTRLSRDGFDAVLAAAQAFASADQRSV